MLKFGKLHGSVLLVLGVGVVLAFFVLGFASAIMLGKMDTEQATAIAGAAVSNSESVAEEQRLAMDRVQMVARRPIYGVAGFARRPISKAARALPTELSNFEPLVAVDQAITRQAEGVAGAADQQIGAVPRSGDLGPEGKDGEKKEADGKDPAKEEKKPEIPKRVLPPEAAKPVVAGAPAGQWSIELGRFHSPDTMAQFLAEMQRRNLPVAVVEARDRSGRTWSHVRLGQYPTEDIAALRLAELQRKENLFGTVVAEAAMPAK